MQPNNGRIRVVPVFQILLHGKGLLLLDQSGNKREGGVYVWRAVTASDEVSALALVQEELLSDSHFTDEVWNESMDHVVFEAEEVIEKTSEEEAGDSGFVFYLEEDS